jgi:Ser/Thr protein kinase RdoA (MazF antagonist)
MPDASWIEQFRSQGYADAAHLGGGMEGAVYRLEDGLVAKVWERKHAVDLEALKAFYEELGEQSLPFATPSIHRVEDIAGVAVTYEAELPGEPLQERLSETDVTAPTEALGCVLQVLLALRGTAAGPAARRLPALDEDKPFAAELDWPTALAAGMDRRMSLHGEPLLAALPAAPHLVEQISGAVMSLPRPPEAILHGDLCGVNVLVNDALEPLSVLDWGFLSTAADPRFEAAVSAGIFNMYGPHARVIEDQIVAALADTLGYDAQVLRVYRAAYAVLTNNVYDPAGKDGHFAWCVATLERPDILAAIAQLSSDA